GIFGTGRDATDLRLPGAEMTASEVDAWFVREVLPLESLLMQYLRRNWRDRSDLEDIRQDIYVRVYRAAREEIPNSARAFLFTAARNHLINLAKQSNIVPIDAAVDFENAAVESESLAPDRAVAARQELLRLQDALEKLPPRQREAVELARIEGFSGKEIATRMGITKGAVSQYLKQGLHALSDHFLREPIDPGRRS
ncbi:MAG TPA: RNA polymerase sigma factor, partial [Terriglobales bacterium]|nr:RNA polymerase sigma factor [Terriglobales bacterium]